MLCGVWLSRALGVWLAVWGVNPPKLYRLDCCLLVCWASWAEGAIIWSSSMAWWGVPMLGMLKLGDGNI